MQPNTLDPMVLKAAQAVRKEVEIWAHRLSDPEDCMIDPDSLTGCCAIASYLLHRTLTHLGIKSTLTMGRFFVNGRPSWDDDANEHCNHCWVVVDGQIVDVTASQFGCPDPVFVGPIDDDRYYVVRSGAAARHNILRDWNTQSPVCYPNSMSSILKQVSKEVRV